MKKNMLSSDGHTWRFFRAGGFDQVRLDTAKDLLSLAMLDQKLWVALACPLDNVNFDARTLSLIDADGDRRIRPAELIAAIKWTASLLKNPDDLTDAKTEFTLQAINDATDEGRALSAAARKAIKSLGKLETDAITLADTELMEKALSQQPFNGDGVITVESVTDDSVAELIGEIIEALGPVTDRSGNPGINAEKVETFFAQARQFEAWFAKSERDPAIHTLGDATENAAKTFAAVQDKIEDYFVRCAIAGFDDAAVAAMNSGEKHYEEIGIKLLSLKSDEIAVLPLARIHPGSSLPLEKNLNPAWTDTIKNFATDAVCPLLGQKETLTENEWRFLVATFTPWFAWLAHKPMTVFDAMGIGRVREVIKGTAQEDLLALIEKDKAESATFNLIVSLEKLIRFRRDLHKLCINFVNFKDFYARDDSAIFQAGTLYLDQRSCNLCLKIEDANKHSMMAAMAGTYLVYCECRRRGGEEKMSVVAAFTNGDSDNLMVGRNGVFYDRAGNDWDASIIKIIENPISLRQAFWLPYKGLVRMIESQVAKRAMAADAQSNARLQQTAETVANIDNRKPEPPPKKLDIGVVAALGVAAGALGTFVATLLGYATGIIRLGPLAIIGVIAGVFMLISGPSLVIAYIKLRKRNLGPILDASGWAINAKARINVPFGTVLTQVASLPSGSQRDLVDPYAEKKSPWPKIVIGALLVYIAYVALNHFGFVYQWSGGHIGMKRAGTENAVMIGKTGK